MYLCSVLHSLSLFTYILCFHIDSDPWQWQALSVGQAACSSQREGEQGSHLLSDGADVGHPCRVHAAEALPLPGQWGQSLSDHVMIT